MYILYNIFFVRLIRNVCVVLILTHCNARYLFKSGAHGLNTKIFTHRFPASINNSSDTCSLQQSIESSPTCPSTVREYIIYIFITSMLHEHR